MATPTGSTAYSLSARGPVVSPNLRALLLTPVSPHMLFDRTLVLDPSETVEIEVDGFRRAGLAIDGRLVATLDDGDVVTCRPADETASFVRLSSHHFHQILKAKFGLDRTADADRAAHRGPRRDRAAGPRRSGAGMTAVTGETGAGKTMLVEALELLVGGRADSGDRAPGRRRGPHRRALRASATTRSC